MSFLENLRKKPRRQKQLILIGTLIFTAILLLFGFFLSLKYSFSKIDFSNIPKPGFIKNYLREMKEEIKKSKEDLKVINEKIEKGEKENK